jgi:hypothetical protein
MATDHEGAAAVALALGISARGGRVGAHAAAWSGALSLTGEGRLEPRGAAALRATLDLRGRAALASCNAASVQMALAIAANPTRKPGGFPPSGEFLLYEAIGEDGKQLKDLDGRWYYSAREQAPECTWEAGAPPELTDMPPASIDYGAPLANPSGPSQIWIDRCPYNPAISWPSVGAKDLSLDFTAAAATAGGLVSAVKNVLQQIEKDDFDPATMLSGWYEGMDYPPMSKAQNMVLHGDDTLWMQTTEPNADQRNYTGKNLARLAWDQKAECHVHLTDSSGRRGLRLRIFHRLRSDMVEVEASPLSGAPATLPGQLNWTSECVATLYACCELSNYNTHTPVASRVVFRDSFSTAAAPMPVAMSSTNVAWKASWYKRSLFVGDMGYTVDYDRGGSVADRWARNKTLTVFSLNKSALDSEFSRHWDSVLDLSKNTPNRRIMPASGASPFRAVKTGSRLEIFWMPDAAPLLVWEDPFVDRILVPSSDGTATFL